MLCFVTVFILSFLATEPLLADKLTNDIAAHKIIVFGASGRVGSRVVNEALERGHDVTAVTRNPSAQGQQDGQTKVLAGDILDAARVAELVAGQDVVVVSIRGSADKSKDADKAIQRVAAELLVETLRAMGAAAPRAGAYRIGGDVMLKNESGQSAISMEDYALALIDEVENPLHHQTRFSVAY